MIDYVIILRLCCYSISYDHYARLSIILSMTTTTMLVAYQGKVTNRSFFSRTNILGRMSYCCETLMGDAAKDVWK